MFLVPTSGIDDWKKLLADPEKHWREGYSAHALATRWEGSDGLPPEIAALFGGHTAFSRLHLLLAIPEHRDALPGGSRASQTDLWVLCRTSEGLVSIVVKGNVRESFGPTLSEWMAEETPGKNARWGALCDLLGLSQVCDWSLRYQLVHRTATALLEATRFMASKAVLVVHSFSAHQDGFADFQALARQFGGSISAPGELVSVGTVSRIQLFLGWAQGPAATSGPHAPAMSE